MNWLQASPKEETLHGINNSPAWLIGAKGPGIAKATHSITKTGKLNIIIFRTCVP